MLTIEEVMMEKKKSSTNFAPVPREPGLRLVGQTERIYTNTQSPKS